MRAPILIVDDYPANLMAFQEALKNPRYDLQVASSGREALALVEKTEFAAILLDVRMPDLNGYDTAALMRRRPKSKTTPILFMTAFDAPAREVTEAYAIGTDFIRKPVEDVVLRSKVAAFVDLYFRQREALEWGQELADSAQRRLRLILEQLPVNLCTVNRDLRITFADGGHVRSAGRAGGAIVGRRVTDFADPAERPKIEAAFRSALEGRAATYESSLEGEVFSAHVQPLYEKDRSIVGAICGFIDITRQKEAEERLAELNRSLGLQVEERTRALKQSQTRLHLALEGAGMGCWDLDTRTDGVQWSDLMYRMLGYEPGSFTPTFEDWSKRIHPGDRERVLGEVARAKREGGSYRVEYRIHRADTGELRWLSSRAHIQLDGRGQVEQLAGVTCDITELKRADEARALHAATVESSFDAVVTETLDGTITSWNGSAERIYGYSASEAVGKHISLIVPEDLRAEQESIMDRLRRGERIEHFETRRRTKDGRVLDMSLTVSPVRDSKGEIIGASKVARDLTGRKREQEALREALEESNAFAHCVSHELRAPLRAMGMTSGLLLEDWGAKVDEATRSQLERIVSSAHRLDAMTQDLLAYSKLAHELTPAGPLDPGVVISEVLDAMREDLRRSGAQVSVRPEFSAVRGNSKLLAHAISNLVYNAIKFVAPGAVPRVTIRAERQGEWLRLVVEDNGIGIASEVRSRLFQLFQQLTPQYPGTGIGLAIVRKCVQRMGGRVGVDSVVGSGSKFWIDLPLADP
ncbi:MAG TPA: PAS domain S-box protein [Planctomycetota bacterium]|nr:PAS domain S-box protein [Planctomycetota bacterium]